MGLVAAAAMLGAITVLVSTRTPAAPAQGGVSAPKHQDATGQPPAGARGEPAVPEEPKPENNGKNPAAAEQAPQSDPLVDDGSARAAPSCEEMIAAHPAPRYKLRLSDYLYLLELHTARRELVRGDLDRAHAALCRSLQAPGADNNVWFELAQVLLLRRDGAAAVPWLEKVLELDPRDQRARALLGDALIRAGRVEDARAAWLKSVRVRAEDGERIENLAAGFFTMAERAMSRSNVAEAERFYRRAIALDPSHARARERLAELLNKLGLTDSAVRWSSSSG